MPQFKVKVKDRETGRIESVSVMADTQREANKQAVILARKLLGVDTFDIA